MDIAFEWDEEKARSNYRKHGVQFEEARTVFYDESAAFYHDPEHSDDEDRFILLGMSARLRVVVVCHCFRQSESVIRIISARKATSRESSEYWSER